MDAVIRTLVRAAHAAIALAYIAAGLFLIFTTIDLLGLATFTRNALGILVSIYGLFRLVRAFKQVPIAA